VIRALDSGVDYTEIPLFLTQRPDTGANKARGYWCEAVELGIFSSWQIVFFVFLGSSSGVNLSLLILKGEWVKAENDRPLFISRARKSVRPL
jgi:hypothetical protein